MAGERKWSVEAVKPKSAGMTTVTKTTENGTVTGKEGGIKDYSKLPTDPENETKSIKDDNTIIRQRRWKTATIYFCHIGHGMWLALFGAILVDLEQLMDVNTQEISAIFTWRNSGIMLGCLLAGYLSHRINQHIFVGLNVFALGVLNLVISWCTNLMYFNIILAFHGLFAGFHIAGSTAFIIDIWGVDSALFLQVFYLSLLIGCTLSPQMAKPFLAGNYKKGSPHHKVDNITVAAVQNGAQYRVLNGVQNGAHYGIQNGVHNEVHNIASNSTVYMGNLTLDSTTLKTSTANTTTIVPVVFETNIHYTFIIVGFVLISGAILHLVNFSVSGCTTKHIQLYRKHRDVCVISSGSDISTVAVNEHYSSKEHILKKRTKFLHLLIIVLVCIAAFIFGGSEDLFGSFLVDFAVKQLEWNVKMATNMATLFFAADGLSRLIAAVLCRWMSVYTLMAISTVTMVISSLIMTFTADLTHVTMWLGVAGVGLGLGCIVGYLVVIGKEVISRTDLLSSIVLVSIYTGKAVTPPLIGYLFQNVTYMYFLYFSVIYSLVLFGTNILLNILRFFKRRKRQKDKEDPMLKPALN